MSTKNIFSKAGLFFLLLGAVFFLQHQASAYCGDGIIEAPGEECDDIITTDGNGCDSSCQVEDGYVCEGEPSVCNIRAHLRAKQAGSPDWDAFGDLAIDSNGNTYSFGYFGYDGVTMSFDTINLVNSLGEDVYLAKQDSDGNFLRAVSSTGGDNEEACGVLVDSLGNIYILGRFSVEAYLDGIHLTPFNGTDLFVAKYNANGAVQRAKRVGSYNNDSCGLFTMDDEENLYFGINSSAGVYMDGEVGEVEVGDGNSIIKIDSNGNYLEAILTGTSVISDMTLDQGANRYIMGKFEGTETFGSDTLVSNGRTDVFIAKQNANGEYLWAKGVGGSTYDNPYSIIIGDDGFVYALGEFQNTAVFGDDTYTSSGGRDAFVSKLDPDTGDFIWTQKIGGASSYDQGYDMKSDGLNNIYIVGQFGGSVYFGDTLVVSNGSNDAFLTKLDSAGNFLFAQNYGGIDGEVAYSIDVDEDGGVYVGGVMYGGSGDFGGTILETNTDSADQFTLKYVESTPAKVYDTYIEGQKGTSIDDVALTAGESVVVKFGANNWTSSSLSQALIRAVAPFLDGDIAPGEATTKTINFIPLKVEAAREQLKNQ